MPSQLCSDIASIRLAGGYPTDTVMNSLACRVSQLADVDSTHEFLDKNLHSKKLLYLHVLSSEDVVNDGQLDSTPEGKEDRKKGFGWEWCTVC